MAAAGHWNWNEEECCDATCSADLVVVVDDDDDDDIQAEHGRININNRWFHAPVILANISTISSSVTAVVWWKRENFDMFIRTEAVE